ncbi:MAG: ABC transporter permease [Lachnospiraceae bacterium]|nr:ABC transporter permease [Lachnospiraceae bacterium]MDE6184349.1 ABC transporter permease [Lachnospiraceae bacterium]MDE7286226.1 ABC transporter permease [Lachnospiraceae bacterium]
MKQIISIIFSTQFFYSILRISTPIMFASMGALITSRAGVINIGLEGIMLFAALSGVIFSAASGSAWVGFLGAVVTGVLIAILMSYVALVLKSHITLTGIAINMFASGCTVFILYLVTGDKGISSSLASKVMPVVELPLINKIPILGEIISGHNILTYLSFLGVLFTYVLLNKTVVGLRIRAVGENEQAALSVGAKPVKYQFIAMLISGVLAGMGGAYMSMGYVSWFSRDMVAGRGFIALAAQQLGQGTTLGTMSATLVFGMADALANNLQALQMPSEFVQSIPYVTTIIGLVVFSIAKQRKELKRIRENNSKTA